MKSFVIVLGIAVSLWGAPAPETQRDTSHQVSDSSELEQSMCGAEQSSASAQPMSGNTCADMGWYEHDSKEACDNACGHSCVKKQWCGDARCEPWPHYCWKCS
jgi:hypothetical protein